MVHHWDEWMRSFNQQFYINLMQHSDLETIWLILFCVTLCFLTAVCIIELSRYQCVTDFFSKTNETAFRFKKQNSSKKRLVTHTDSYVLPQFKDKVREALSLVWRMSSRKWKSLLRWFSLKSLTETNAALSRFPLHCVYNGFEIVFVEVAVDFITE